MKQINLTVLFCFILSCSWLNAEIIHVPADTASIQGAINMAQNGDTVLVAEGRYYENIVLRQKSVTLASRFLIDSDTSHISRTIIDGSQPSNPDSASTVAIAFCDTNMILVGFTITGGAGTKFDWEDITGTTGGGVLIDSSGAKIINNKICANIINDQGKYCYAGGIEAFCLAGMSIIIKNNEICHNEVHTYWGGAGGAEITGHGYIIFKNNSVHHNLFAATGAGHGGGLASAGANSGIYGRIVVIANKITDNEAIGSGNDSWGGGVYSESPNFYMLNNIIARNKAYYGGGVSILSLSSFKGRAKASVINNTITKNIAGKGGAIWNRQSDVVVLNSIMWGNQASSELDGMSAYQMNVQYTNIPMALPGTHWGNIKSDPLFADTINFQLSEDSPCIDAGADLAIFNDPGNGSLAILPSLGTIKNDMGAYGGPYAYDWTQLDNAIDTVLYVPALSGTNPDEFRLMANYPNPFNPATEIAFTLPIAVDVVLEVFNTAGQRIRILVNHRMSAGTHSVTFNAQNLASGIYMYRLTAGEFRQARKMVLVK